MSAFADILDNVLRFSPLLRCFGTALVEPTTEGGNERHTVSLSGLREMSFYGRGTEAPDRVASGRGRS